MKIVMVKAGLYKVFENEIAEEVGVSDFTIKRNDDGNWQVIDNETDKVIFSASRKAEAEDYIESVYLSDLADLETSAETELETSTIETSVSVKQEPVKEEEKNLQTDIRLIKEELLSFASANKRQDVLRLNINKRFSHYMSVVQRIINANIPVGTEIKTSFKKFTKTNSWNNNTIGIIVSQLNIAYKDAQSISEE